MGKEVEEGLIYTRTGFRLYRTMWGDRIELEGVFKPLEAQGWGGNYEKYVITVYDNHVEVKRVRNNWNGTGSDIISHCSLAEKDAEKLREQIMHAKDISDFQQLLNNLLATC